MALEYSFSLGFKVNEMNDREKSFPIITIDGPAGSGKGTISQRVADRLEWHILDSGALYRLVALAAQNQQIDLDNEDALALVAKQLDVVFKTSQDGGVVIHLNGNDVSLTIRTEEVGSSASKVAAKPKVRAALLERQRRFQMKPGLVADGRDMGTVVFPKAELKVFLTASSEIRAERRLNQLKQQGISGSLRALISDIEIRDERDMNRKDSPLIPATEAIIIDTGKLSIDEVVNQVFVAVEKVFPSLL